MSEEAFGVVGSLIERVRLKAALQETLAVARRANQYLSEEKPWLLLKTDRSRAAAVIYTALVVVDRLKTMLCPFLPHSSQRLHDLLGYGDVIASAPEVEKIIDPDGRERLALSGAYSRINHWEPATIPIGQTLKEPAPLFQKLEESLIDEERERLRGQARRS